jgi:enoyl-CoA hydratase/carnithine racemase
MFEVRDDGPVRRLTISNPGRRNAVPTGQWGRLAELLAEFETSPQRVLLIIGADGDFCSGADLGSEFVPGAVADGYEMVGRVGAAALALHRMTKPTIAAVDGVAAGAGLNLALGCDLLVASTRARFSEIFVKRGLTLDFAGTWLLPRRIGLARAKELALTGRVIDVIEAERLGLVTRVVAPEDLEESAVALARELAAGAPLAQRFVKAGLDRSLEMSFEEALSYEQSAQALLLASQDFFEGVAAFLQKRDPDFQGR